MSVLLALLTGASVAHAATLKDIVDKSIVPLGELIINLLYAFAFLFFLFGIARYFFSTSAQDQEKGKQFALWSIASFFVLFSVWGLVNLLLDLLKGFQ